MSAAAAADYASQKVMASTSFGSSETVLTCLALNGLGTCRTRRVLAHEPLGVERWDIGAPLALTIMGLRSRPEPNR